MCGAGVNLWCSVLLFLLIVIKESKEAQELNNPATDFSRHRIVTPKIHHARTKRQISSTKDKSGAHHLELTMTLEVDGEELQLELQLNHDLITEGHVLQYQKDGQTVTHEPTKEELDLCQYHGTVKGKPTSRVALSTCHGIRGVIFDGEKIIYIEPAQGGDIQSQHYLYDHSDLNTNYNCGYVEEMTNNASYDPILLKKYNQENLKRSARSVNGYKSRAEDVQVRSPYNENKLSRYVELVFVADNAEFWASGGNIRTVHRRFRDLANIINSMYAPLNIFIALVGVVVWNERDEIQLSEDSSTTLTNFKNYRKDKLVFQIPNDNANLLTSHFISGKFLNNVVGKADVGPICTTSASANVATNHTRVLGLLAATIAHEMGHNFGMPHDDGDCACPDNKCIMHPSSSSVMPTRWSSCSTRALALAFQMSMDYCLRNKPKRLFGSPTCGNGFVEPGEQCDCGLPLERGARSACHACCHADTCMLRANATCGAGTCCDLQTCRPRAAGALCRSAERECDLPEYCTGHSEFCPDDVYKMDTTPCGSKHQAYCVRGSCRSHTDQCRLLWGTTGENSKDECYLSGNTQGHRHGHCGYDRIRNEYKMCEKADAMCGLLQCHSLIERPEFGQGTSDGPSQMTYYKNGEITRCRTISLDLGLSDVDPGLVPDGAKCGYGKMCLNQRCVSVESVRASMALSESSNCFSNCSGHGVCNSKGHCHCEAGFSPPLCALPGAGGSVDSGPATDPIVLHNFKVAMYVIFLGIVPFILLVACLGYKMRNRWKKTRQSCINSSHFNSSQKSTTRSFFTNHFRRFQNSTSSLRKLLSFKRNDSVNIDAKQPVHFPENSDKTVEIKVQPLQPKAPPLPAKSPPKKQFRKIIRDDIQITSENSLITRHQKPMPPPKPNNKPRVVIINQGLAFTTNEMVAKGQKSNLHNKGHNGLKPNISVKNVKVHELIK